MRMPLSRSLSLSFCAGALVVAAVCSAPDEARAQWGGWENLGGIILEQPDCVSWGANRLDCFARGTDNAMYHRWWDGSRWNGWESQGGIILDRPDCVSWGANRIDCFARGTNNAMFHRWWDGSRWNGWENLGGIILDRPNCVSWGANRLDCFAVGTDNAMYHRWWDGSRWNGWENLGGIILDRPDCVSWGANRLDCFAPGTDNAMYHRWWPCPGCGSTGSSGQRKSVTALSPSELMSLRRGVAQMMAWNTAPRDSANYRRSWVYWANMHSHFGSDCAGPVSGSGMAGVQTFTAANATETATWCKCEHGTVRFLTWHRMYLWYFERVLQAAAGDPSLRLPYWDYATDPNLPPAYRDQTYVNEHGQTVANPLHVDARQSGLNSGSTGLAPAVRTAAGAMPATNYTAFNSALEQTPHGAVHCAVASAGCPTGLMGAVPAAALDPVFYAHHTNIDRLYQCWLRVDESARLPNDPAHLNAQFSFIDGDGSTQLRRVGDMLRLSQLGYSYTEGGDCPPVTVASAQAPAEATRAAARTEGATVTAETATPSASAQPLAVAGPTRLERGVTTVPITVQPTAAAAPMARAAPQTAQHAYLVIEGLTYDEGPSVLYNVYLKGAGDRREQVGVINFFNFTAHRAGAGADHGSSAGRYVFDVTDAVRQLGIGPGAQPALIFEPATGLANSSPEAATRQISPQANVRFDSARIVTEP